MEDVGGVIIAALGLGTVAGWCGWIAWSTRARALPRNGLVGIRTRATTRSDRAWDAAHDAARPYLLVVCVTGIGTAVTQIVVAAVASARGWSPAPAWIVVIASYLLVMTSLLLGARVGHQAARRSDPGLGDQ